MTAEKVATAPYDERGELTPPRLGRRHRSRSADPLRTRSSEQLTSADPVVGHCHNTHHHDFHHKQYHSDQNILHYHHHHHSDQPPRRRRRRRHRNESQPQQSPPSSADTSCTGSSSLGPEAMALNLSFCGCGFLGMYHLGVASCLVKHGPGFLANVDRVAGASAGALVAALLVTAPTLRHVQASTDMVAIMAKGIRRKPLGALTPGYRIANDLTNLLDRLLPPDAHEIARGKLHVSLTDIKTKQNEVVSEFDSRQELIETLVASCHIPVYSGAKFPSVRGKLYCDGGLTNNLLRFKDGRTVTVSPFSGKQDIGPRDALKKGTKAHYFNLHNQDIQLNFNNIRRLGHAFFPPKSGILQQYFELGHKDASRFLVREGLYEITKPGDRKPLVYESSV